MKTKYLAILIIVAASFAITQICFTLKYYSPHVYTETMELNMESRETPDGWRRTTNKKDFKITEYRDGLFSVNRDTVCVRSYYTWIP